MKTMPKYNLKQQITQRIDLVVLVFCLLLTYGAWRFALTQDTTDKDALADVRARVEQEMKYEVEDLFTHINGVRGLYASSVYVDPEELSSYAKITLSSDAATTILRIGFIQKVDEAETEAFEKQVREEGNEGYKAQPNPAYESQYYVAKTVDTQGKIYVPSGRNLLQDPGLARLIEKVITSKQGQVVYAPTSTNIDEYTGPVFVGSLPVYQNDKLLGLVNGVVSVKAIEQKIDAIVGSEVGWKWSITDGTVLHDSEPIGGNTVSDTVSISLFEGVVWTIELTKADVPSSVLNLIFGVGVFVSFMLYAMVYGLTTANVRAEALARVMTQEFEKYKLALDSTNTHAIITDPNGKIVYVNAAAEKLTGYTKEEVLGKTPAIWGKQMDAGFYHDFWQTIKEERKVYKGEITNRRKNGDSYTVSAVISPIVVKETNELLGFVGIEEDITLRKKNEDELKRMNDLMVGREIRMAELKAELAKYQDGEPKHV